MTFEEWKKLKAIRGEDAKRIVRDFERSNPGLAALYERQQGEETQKMRQAMDIPDRMERWRRIAELTSDPEFAERRRREIM